MLNRFSRSSRLSMRWAAGLASLLALTGCVGATTDGSGPGAVSSIQAPDEHTPSHADSDAQAEGVLGPEPGGT